MATSYEKCDKVVDSVVQRMMKKYHPELIECGVTVQCIFANAGVDKHGQPKQAVKINGVPGSAKVRKVPLKDRASGNADSEIIIDEQIWERLSEKERDALIDHELHHLEPNGDTDDLGRPVIKLRKHDWEIWGFKTIVERHGKAALEFQAAQHFKDEFGQLLMWAEDAALVG